MSDVQPTIPAEPTAPFPPRFWWLKRLTLLGFAILVVCAGLRVWWGVRVRRQFDREMAARREAGERVWPADFESPPLPDADNGAYYLKLAFQSIDPNVDFPAQSNWSYRDYLPYPRMWVRMSTKAAAADTKALELAHEATRHPRVDWGFRAATPPWMLAAPFGGLNGLRNLANVLGDATILAHIQGDDALAVQRIEDLLFLARAINAQPMLIAGLVANGIDAVADHRIQVIAAELNIADAPADDVPPTPAMSPTTRPVSRARVKALIARLLDEAERRARARQTYEGERMLSFGELQWRTGRSLALRPMFQQDQLHAVSRAGVFVAAATQPSWPDAQQVFGSAGYPATLGTTRPPAQANLQGVAHGMSGMMTWSLDRAVLTQFRVVLDRHMAAVALATRMYVIDHAGAFPPNLQALVPDYLPEVPRDVMAPDGRPLGYFVVSTELGPRQLVYSIGEDGVDQTAGRNGSLIPPTPMHEFERTVDQWRDLSRYSPPPPPASQRGEGEMPEDDDPPTTAASSVAPDSAPSATQPTDH